MLDAAGKAVMLAQVGGDPMEKKADVEAWNVGTIWTFLPVSDRGKRWIDDKVQPRGNCIGQGTTSSCAAAAPTRCWRTAWRWRKTTGSDGAREQSRPGMPVGVSLRADSMIDSPVPNCPSPTRPSTVAASNVPKSDPRHSGTAC